MMTMAEQYNTPTKKLAKDVEFQMWNGIEAKKQLSRRKEPKELEQTRGPHYNKYYMNNLAYLYSVLLCCTTWTMTRISVLCVRARRITGIAERFVNYMRWILFIVQNERKNSKQKAMKTEEEKILRTEKWLWIEMRKIRRRTKKKKHWEAKSTKWTTLWQSSSCSSLLKLISFHLIHSFIWLSKWRLKAANIRSSLDD